MKKIAIITECGECPHFDNFDLKGECQKLNKVLKIPHNVWIHPIPNDCPLSDLNEIKGVLI